MAQFRGLQNTSPGDDNQSKRKHTGICNKFHNKFPQKSNPITLNFGGLIRYTVNLGGSIRYPVNLGGVNPLSDKGNATLRKWYIFSAPIPFQFKNARLHSLLPVKLLYFFHDVFTNIQLTYYTVS